MLRNALIVGAVLLAASVLLWPRLANAPRWRATVTPLASIIGSGFLVLGPILIDAYGKYAPLMMAALCAGAYAFGAAVRFNIARIAACEEAGSPRSAFEERIETVASWALAFSYIVSVAYYLNLFGAFGVRLTPFDSPLAAKLLTSAIFLVILVVGWLRGFGALERMEEVTVGIKLAIIMGLVVGLGLYFSARWSSGDLIFVTPTKTGWAGIALAFGLIVTVQGFETSRYLGAHYDAPMRIRSMRDAQWLSSLIYMAYIGLVSYVFARDDLRLAETAIVGMMAVVASVLPALLVAAALSAQFSAAVADTNGAGGLFVELTGRRFKPKFAYAVLVGVGLALTWVTDLFEIINYASRAFALYYGLQAAIAARGAALSSERRWRAWPFAALAVLGLTILVFGASVEGG